MSGREFELRIEGLAPSATPDNLIVLTCQRTDAQNNPLGLPVSDSVKVEVVSIDIEIAQISELDEETQPAFVPVNDDYDEQNTHGISHDPVTDNCRLHEQLVSVAPRIESTDDELVHAKLTIDGPNGQHGKYWIEVLNEPTTVNGSGTGQGGYPGYEQYIRVWLPNGTAVPRDAANALPITLDANAVDLLIDGLAEYYSVNYPLRLKAHFIPDGDYAAAGVFPDVMDAAIAEVFFHAVDLDVDSNNDGEIDPWNGAAGEDDPIEEELPGKLVRLNNDDDNGNGIPDREESWGATVAGEDDLAELRLHAEFTAFVGELEDWSLRLEAGLDDLAKIRLYDSPTKGVPYIFQSGGGAGSLTFNIEQSIFDRTLWVEVVSVKLRTFDFGCCLGTGKESFLPPRGQAAKFTRSFPPPRTAPLAPVP